MNLIEWLNEIKLTVPEWLDKLAISGRIGQFNPCLNGLTKVGKNARLGFSCFALRIYYILGLWDKFDEDIKSEWIDYILSFQINNGPFEGAFIDPVIINNCYQWKNKLLDLVLKRRHPGISHKEATIIAETKQAIATLAQVGINAPIVYRNFPQNVDALKIYLKDKLNWNKPWAAGGQSAAIAVFICHEAPRFLSLNDVNELRVAMRDFFFDIVDPETGGWYIGKRPSYGELINGAMKVINALEWLEAEIPYPDRLIETALSQLPRNDGCHLIDTVYVLFKCSRQSSYKKREILEYYKRILEMIKLHYRKDGAFSYYLKSNQTNYYGARIAKSLEQSDIHGTYLLLYAIAMILEILQLDVLSFKYVKT
jgi:hypothetical protein